MSLNNRLDRLESLLQPPVPEPWTTWQQDEADPDLFHCIAGSDDERGTAARWDDLAGRPRVTLIEYTEDYEGTGEPATIMHLPGLTRVYGVGRDEGL